MKLIYSNIKNGEIRLLTQNLDDLWYLSNIIEHGDLVKGKTMRKVNVHSDEERAKESKRISVFIKIEVEKIEFSKYSNVLRISGIIRGAPEDIALGDHHTFNVDDNTTITLIKEKWIKYQLDKLKEACAEPTYLLLCVHDREEAYFSLFKKYGYEILAHITEDVKKKREENNVKKGNIYATIISKIKEYVERYNLNQVIIASPGFWKEDLIKELKDDKLKQKIILATCSSVTKNGIDEVIKRPEVREALKHERTAKEINEVEELFTEIAKNNLGVYGLVETSNASLIGAVRKLLITDDFLKKSRIEGFYDKLDTLMKSVDKSKGNVEIISSEHDWGKRLDGLGGIGAILRYKVKY